MSVSVIRRLFFVMAIPGAAAVSSAGCASGSTPTSTEGSGGDASTSSSGAGGRGGAGGAGGCVDKEDCAALTDACNEGNCVNAECAKTPKIDGTSCDDGVYCTEADSCHAGVCSGQPRVCPGQGACMVGVCDVALDACAVEPGNNGAPCANGDPCWQASTCQNGACVGALPTDCSFLDQACGFGVCVPNVGCDVMPASDGTFCDDFQFCTINDACQSGVCTGDPKPCAAPGNPCLIGTCNEFNQTCSVAAGNDGAACDDANPCTMGEICGSGLCGNGAPANIGGACDDNNPCTPASTCGANGVCVGNNPIVQCVAGDGCCPAGCVVATDADCSQFDASIAPVKVSGALVGCTTAGSNTGRKVAIDGDGTFYVAMTCGGEAYITVSTNHGVSFLPSPVDLNSSADEIAVTGGEGSTAHAVVSTGGSLVYFQTTNSGATWTPGQILDSTSAYLSIASEGTNVYIMYNGLTGARVMRSSASGAPGTFLPTDVGISPVFGDVMLSGTTVWVAGDTPELHIASSNNGAASFSAALQPTGTAYYSDWALGAGKIFVTGDNVSFGIPDEVDVLDTATGTTTATLMGLPSSDGTDTRAISAGDSGDAYIVTQSLSNIVLSRVHAGVIEAPIMIGVGYIPAVVAAPGPSGHAAAMAYENGGAIYAAVHAF